ncbi:hypothetical protein [Streptomyces alanosinicus]|nr:hypothetical protein [Streptomyces alanosinicus]
MRRTFLATGVALAATLTGCTAAQPPAAGSPWNAEAVREATEEFTSLCAEPAGPPGTGGGAPPAAQAVARTGAARTLAARTEPSEGDEEPMPPLPDATLLVFCVYSPPPVSTSPVPAPEPPSCPARQVSVARPRAGVAWAVAPDGTPTPFPYPRLAALHEENCAPVVEDSEAWLWH